MKQKHDIHVSVDTFYIAERSEPMDGSYVFAYTITITNRGSLGAQLMTRHWIVTDSDEREQHVRGEGVVGEQPHINPGERFQYTSGVILETPVGTMEGSYQMIADDGSLFDAKIAKFVLSAQATLH